MLRFKNLFLLAIFALTAGLFINGCEIDPVDDEEYTATIRGGTMWEWNSYGPTTEIASGTVIAKEKVIYLEADDDIVGQRFSHWTISAGQFQAQWTAQHNPTYFIMPASDVTITAVYDYPYTVIIEGGTGKLKSDPAAIWEKELDLYAGDVIDLQEDALNDVMFYEWSVQTPAVTGNPFNNKMNPTTTFTMPAITADTLIISGRYIYDGMAEVRFSWEKKYNDKITHISASVEDIDWWVDEVLYGSDAVPEDFLPIGIVDPETGDLDLPLSVVGNPGVTESIFKPGVGGVSNHGVYYETQAGHFLAVCGLEDEYGLFEIVADYKIELQAETAELDGSAAWFEIGFDIEYAIEEGEESQVYWFKEIPNYDQGTIFRSALSEHLSLLKKKTFVKKLKTVTQETKKGTLEANYYLIRRAK